MSENNHKISKRSVLPVKTRWLAFLLIFALFLSCRKEEVLPDLPALVTGKVTDINKENGAAFHAKILTEHMQQVTEHGFVWDTTENVTLSSSRIYLDTLETDQSFHLEKTGDLFANKVYYVKSFIKTGNQLEYGNWSKFTSAGGATPVIEGFEPEQGGRNSIITIYGKHFSYIRNHIRVKLGPVYAWVFKASEHEIKVKLPQKINISGKVKIVVEVAGVTGVSAKEFILDGPLINSIEPASGTCHSTITLTGEKLQSSNHTYIFFKSTDERYPDEVPVKILETSGDQITFEVPVLPTLGTYNVILKQGYLITTSPEIFTLIGAEITSVQPLQATAGTVLTITGNHLNEGTDSVQVFLGNEQKLKIIEVSNHTIKAVVPNDMLIGSYNVFMPYDCNEAVSSENITVTSPWETIENVPELGSVYPVSFSFNNKFFVTLGVNECTGGGIFSPRELWEYDPSVNLWTRKADFPGEGRFVAVSGVIDTKTILGMGLKSSYDPPMSDFWLYDPATDTWDSIPSPGRGEEAPLGFSIDHKFYCSLGPPVIEPNTTEFYAYDINTGNWNFIGYLPEIDHSEAGSAFSSNGMGYMIIGKEYYMFDPGDNSWTRLNDLTEPILNIFNGPDETVALSYDNELFLFDPDTGDLRPLPPHLMLGPRTDFIGIILDHYLYIGLGRNKENCLSDIIKLNLADLP